MTIKRFRLERYLAGEIVGNERETLEAELADDDAAKAVLEQLKRDSETFEAQVPYDRFRIEHERRKALRQPSRARWLGWSFGLGASVAALLAVVITGVPQGSTPPETRLKGDGVALSFYVLEPNGTVERGVSGQELRPGDRIQLAYEANGFSYAAVFGIEESGAVRRYWPATGEKMLLLSAEQGSFEFALTLDDTRGRETFMAVFSRNPASLASIEEAIERAHDHQPTWPSGVVSAQISVRKP